MRGSSRSWTRLYPNT